MRLEFERSEVVGWLVRLGLRRPTYLLRAWLDVEDSVDTLFKLHRLADDVLWLGHSAREMEAQAASRLDLADEVQDAGLAGWRKRYRLRQEAAALLAAALGDEVHVTVGQLRAGVVITAGDVPDLGELEAGLTRAVKALAHKLERLAAHDADQRWSTTTEDPVAGTPTSAWLDDG